MSSVRPELLVGDRYRLSETIAVGGMGEVWRAVDQRLGRPVAVKILKPEYAADPSFLERFRAEGRHAASLSHAGIAGVFDYGEVDGTAYLVMELVDGEPLSGVLARQGALPVTQALDVVGQAALALQAAHDAGVVHRDVKPGNLLLRPDGVVKVTDFGIARAIDAVPLTRTGTVLGTAHYLSPEQAQGGEITPRSDVYALGVVAYECLTGRRPFEADNPFALARAHVESEPPALPDEVPGPVRVLVEQALAKDPDRRPESAGVFGRTALALRAAMTDEPPASPLPVDPPAATRRSPTRPYTRLQPAGGAAAGAAAGGVGAAAAGAATAAGGARPRDTSRGTPPDGAGPPRRRPTAPPRPAAAVGAAGGWRHPLSWPARTARLVLVGAVLLAIVLAGFALRAFSDQPTGDRSSSQAPPADSRVRVPVDDLVGRPVDDATATLRRLGLTARTVSAESDAPPGSVTSVRPTGLVPAGSIVTLSVASTPEPAAAPEDKDKKDDDKGKGPGDGHDHGNGHGDDKGGKGGDD